MGGEGWERRPHGRERKGVVNGKERKSLKGWKGRKIIEGKGTVKKEGRRRLENEGK